MDDGSIQRMNDTTEFRSVTFQLHPGTRARHRKLAQIAGACRYVWNHFLACNRRDHATYKLRKLMFDAGLLIDKPSPPSLSFQSMGVRFTALRRETPWLQRLPYAPVRYALKYQAEAWARAFGGGGFPKFKARRGDDSFTIPQDVSVRDGVLIVPKVGRVRLSRRGGNPYAEYPPVKATVKRVNGKWYCVVVYRVSAVARPDNGLALGVDMNCGQVAASTGELLRIPDMARLQARKRRYQRMVSRRRKGSNRRNLARHRLARTQRRIATIRHRWHHETSRTLADTAGLLAVEDLKAKAMTRSARGTAKHPGRHVRQKAGLNREILNTGWSQLRRMLEYKAAHVEAVAPMYTSQTCRGCGAVDPANRKSQSEFKCVRCGHTGNADVNAALNIMASATGAAGRRGALALATPMNRQHVYGRRAA